MDPDDRYGGLNKKLGRDNRNGDVRHQVQGHFDEYIENHLSPGIWQSCNPAYRLENKMDKTEFRSTFQGKKEEATDKVYFRKKDDNTAYAEALFKERMLFKPKQ